MNGQFVNSFVLNHIMEEKRLFYELEKIIDEFFLKYKIPDWLTQNQARMINEILSSKNRQVIETRLGKYKDRQLKRKSQKNKWQKDVGGEKAIEALYNMVVDIPNTDIMLIIRNEFNKFNIDFDPDLNNEFVYNTLIQKLDYLFIMKYSIQRKGDTECLKN